LPQKRTRLIVGLGNPGTEYEHTRHNAGFMVVDKLAGDSGISLNKNKFDVRYGRGIIEDHDVMLANPMAFMNRSGPPVQKLAAYFKIPSEDLMVIHDDIDLAFGRLKIKEKGGHGGQSMLSAKTNLCVFALVLGVPIREEVLRIMFWGPSALRKRRFWTRSLVRLGMRL
jgi:PTH1 family peptidyl-tRNA hydrolase